MFDLTLKGRICCAILQCFSHTFSLFSSRKKRKRIWEKNKAHTSFEESLKNSSYPRERVGKQTHKTPFRHLERSNIGDSQRSFSLITALQKSAATRVPTPDWLRTRKPGSRNRNWTVRKGNTASLPGRKRFNPQGNPESGRYNPLPGGRLPCPNHLRHGPANWDRATPRTARKSYPRDHWGLLTPSLPLVCTINGSEIETSRVKTQKLTPQIGQ